jgi:hypothetical protein
MEHRTHFWLRMLGIGVIVALQFGPRLWAYAAAASAQAPVTAALVAR